MITAKLFFDPLRGNIRLRLRGHAASAPKGEDLICAGVSALALTAAQCAALLHSRGLLSRPPLVHLKSGDTTVLVTPREDALSETLLCFWTVQAGLYALQQRFPEYVQIAQVLHV